MDQNQVGSPSQDLSTPRLSNPLPRDPAETIWWLGIRPEVGPSERVWDPSGTGRGLSWKGFGQLLLFCEIPETSYLEGTGLFSPGSPGNERATSQSESRKESFPHPCTRSVRNSGCKWKEERAQGQGKGRFGVSQSIPGTRRRRRRRTAWIGTELPVGLGGTADLGGLEDYVHSGSPRTPLDGHSPLKHPRRTRRVKGTASLIVGGVLDHPGPRRGGGRCLYPPSVWRTPRVVWVAPDRLTYSPTPGDASTLEWIHFGARSQGFGVGMDPSWVPTLNQKFCKNRILEKKFLDNREDLV